MQCNLLEQGAKHMAQLEQARVHWKRRWEPKQPAHVETEFSKTTNTHIFATTKHEVDNRSPFLFDDLDIVVDIQPDSGEDLYPSDYSDFLFDPFLA
jgi:hypothetical protein